MLVPSYHVYPCVCSHTPLPPDVFVLFILGYQDTCSTCIARRLDAVTGVPVQSTNYKTKRSIAISPPRQRTTSYSTTVHPPPSPSSFLFFLVSLFLSVLFFHVCPFCLALLELFVASLKLLRFLLS